MSKLQAKAKKSKLSIPVITNQEKLLTTQRKLVYPISFRLDADNWQRLQTLLAKVQQETGREISLTQLLKTLIHCGGELNKAKWEKGLKEINY